MIAPTYLNEAAKIINEGITYSAPTPSQRAAIYALNHSETLIPLVTETFQKTPRIHRKTGGRNPISFFTST